MEIGTLVARSRGLLDAGKYAEAVHVLESAVRRQPQFPDLHHLLGVALSMVGEPLRAESHLVRALELNPNYAEAHLNLAILLFERNAYASARDHLRAFDRVVRGNQPGLPDPALDDLARRHADLAERYRGFGLLAEAEAELRAALRLRPAYSDIRLALGRVLFERGHLQDAADCLATLLAQTPGYQDAQVLLGRVERARGHDGQARRIWSQVRGGAAAAQARAFLDQMDGGLWGPGEEGAQDAGQRP